MRKLGRRTAFGSLAMVAVAVGSIAAAKAHSGYTERVVATIPLPGHSQKGDVVAADAAANKVYVAQQGNNSIDVIDANQNAVVAVIHGIHKGYGVTFDKNDVFAASTGDSAIYVIDKANWRVIKKVPAGGSGADGIVYDEKDNAVAVVNDFTNNVEFVSGTSPFSVLDRVRLQPTHAIAGPDLPAYVAQTDTLYVPDDNDINVIDAKTHRVEHVWHYADVPVDSKNQIKGLYYDPVRRVLWVATTGKKVLAVNPLTGREIAFVKTTAGSDQIVGDAKKRLLYLGEGEFGGWLGVINMDTMHSLPDSYPGGKDAEVHTEDVMPTTGDLYAYGSKVNKVFVLNIQPQSP